jgi:Family of unknown function (DUF5906)/RepB DNA-primase from phage plasmid
MTFSEQKARASPEPSAAANPATVREFVAAISERCAGLDGLLQLTRIHPADGKLAWTRYATDDIGRMVEAAIADAEAGHNVYCEPRVIRRDTPPGERGDARYTAAVFALVVDSDGWKNKACDPRLVPSMVVETSPGSHHFWYFLDKPIAESEASEIGAAMRAAGGDTATGRTGLYRVAGTANYPDKKKTALRGPGVHPVTLAEPFCGVVYTADDLRAAFPPKAKQKEQGDAAGDGVDWRLAWLTLPDQLKTLIRDGVPEGDRSEKFHSAVGWLRRLGWNLDNVVAVLETHPEGIAKKYAGRLREEVERSFEKVDGPPHEAGDPDLAAMNEKYAVVMIGGKARIAWLEHDPSLQPVFATFEDFTKFHAMPEKRIGKNNVGIGKWWIGHPQRRQYDGVVFAPLQNIPGKWNLWTGFSCEPCMYPSGGGSVRPYLEHLLDNVCRRNLGHFRYLLGWMADAVQNPGRHAATAIVLRGKEGTGKNVAVEEFGKLFGPHFLRVVQTRHLTGNFNAHLQNIVVLNANEAFFAGDKQHEGVIKALVTEPRLTIEPKGLNPYEVQNCLHIMLSSNESWVVPASMEARRWFVLDVSEDHMQDHDYFANIANNMNSGGRDQLLHMLQSFGLEKIKGRLPPGSVPWEINLRQVPKTAALADQEQRSRRGIEALVEQLAHDGQLFDAHPSKPNVGITTSSKERRGFYVEAQQRFYDLKFIGWVTAFRQLKRDWGCVPFHSGALRGVSFPPLKVFRQKVDEKFGPQDWDDTPEWTSPWDSVVGS